MVNRKGRTMDDLKEDRASERSREKLKRNLETRFMQSVDEILDMAEIIIADPQYRKFRSKVLRSANNSIRDLKKELDLNYKVVFIPSKEDIIEVSRPHVDDSYRRNST